MFLCLTTGLLKIHSLNVIHVNSKEKTMAKNSPFYHKGRTFEETIGVTYEEYFEAINLLCQILTSKRSKSRVMELIEGRMEDDTALRRIVIHFAMQKFTDTLITSMLEEKNQALPPEGY